MRRARSSVRRGWIPLPSVRRTPRIGPFTLHETRSSRYDNPDNPSSNSHEDQPGNGSFRTILEGSTVALVSLVGLGLGGYVYSSLYRNSTLNRIEAAFVAECSPDGSVAAGRIPRGSRPDTPQEPFEKNRWVPRPEQGIVDAIINGTRTGRYYVVFGERGTGKRTLLLESMKQANGDGVTFLEAHNDLEVFRARLGKAIDYEFHEDYIGGLFSIKGPRDSTPLLDIERALDKMEKVAVKMRKYRRRPLVLVILDVHHLKDDQDGRSLLELLQQRAEAWAKSELVSTVFTSDDHWTLERLKPRATNMQVISVRDAPKDVAMSALKAYRARHFNEQVSPTVLEEIYTKIGGRLIFLKRVAKSKDMLATCDVINKIERLWLLNQCWILGDAFDGDVENDQKLCVAAMILARALVLREEQSTGPSDGQKLPQIPLHEARQIIARSDFTQILDQINVIHIDANCMVRADSVPMQNAFRDICNQPGFEEHLKATLERLDELERLGRTREVSHRELPRNAGGEILKQKYFTVP